jgi:fatty-acyl-CoA synthase
MLRELEPQLQRAAPAQWHSTKFPFLRRLVALRSVTDAGADDGAGDAIESWSQFLADGADVPRETVDARAAGVQPSDAGALFFSSGTTSLPKGILHAQRAPCIHWWRWPRLLGLNEPVRSWTGNGFFWSANFTMVAGAAFSTGGAIVLQPTFDAEQALALMQAERVSLPVGRPHQWARLQAAPNWNTADLSSVRYIDRRMALAAHPTIRTDWQLPPSYGNTETLTINASFANSTPAEITGTSHGEPLPGNTIKIVDPMTGAVRARGARGEIAVKGPTLMLGYVGKPFEESFDAEGYFRTGDGGYLDDRGRLFWEGRLTEVIKTGGANVSPLEVDALLGPYPGVKIAQTVGVPHDTLGEMVVSCIVPLDSAALDEVAVRGFLKERLASYKVPRRVLFFDETEMAVTANGKVRIGELRELASKRLGLAVTASEG